MRLLSDHLFGKNVRKFGVKRLKNILTSFLGLLGRKNVNGTGAKQEELFMLLKHQNDTF